MIAYSRDEIISASDVARNFSAVLKDIVNHTKERFAISKNNKLEAVVLPIDEYERLKEAYDLMEHTEIYKIVQLRKNSKTISFEDSASKYGIDLNAL
ncbi:MAG: type II toxin-antitoxin system Phd/YefM family antitoxin [Sulfurimonas sp.]|jgi:prevent-host-death family protein